MIYVLYDAIWYDLQIEANILLQESSTISLPLSLHHT